MKWNIDHLCIAFGHVLIDLALSQWATCEMVQFSCVVADEQLSSFAAQWSFERHWSLGLTAGVADFLPMTDNLVGVVLEEVMCRCVSEWVGGWVWEFLLREGMKKRKEKKRKKKRSARGDGPFMSGKNWFVNKEVMLTREERNPSAQCLNHPTHQLPSTLKRGKGIKERSKHSTAKAIAHETDAEHRARPLTLKW